jgi:hypothetical protein
VPGLAGALRVPPADVGRDPVDVEQLPSPASLVQRARACARWTGQTEVHARHLLAAAATADAPIAPAALAALGVTARELRDLLREAVRRMVPAEAPAVWDEILAETVAEDLAGGITADVVDVERGIPLDQDHLGVGTYVGMLAAVIANESTPLPLSVGLFGEWGSGKSYFMGLLREQVDQLGGRPEDGYLGDIVQITFNAWHYADTNLWASLGNEIFRQLAGPSPSPDQRRETLRRELAEKLQRAGELKAAHEQASRVTADIRKAIDSARAERSRSVGTVLRSVGGSPTFRQQLGRVWGLLGVTDETEQGRLLVDEVQRTGSQTNALRLATAGWRGTALAALGVVAVVLLAGAVLLQGSLGEWLAGGGLSSIGLLLAGLTVWTARARSGLELLAQVAEEVRAGVEERAEEAVAGGLDELRIADAKEQVLQAKLDEVLHRVGELGRELATLSPGQRLYGFLNERAGSEDYRRQLGLISTIRRDFEQLIALMNDWRDNPRGDEEHRPIDRIVLYIDDLDRCSPRQVVDVLQAVHLLLALNLFVVVVGVDPRWLLHSLREKYRTAFTPGGSDGARAAAWDEDEADAWRTTPQNYLEKIFNIPFVLPSMTSDSFAELIRKLSVPDGHERPPVVVPDLEREPDLDPGDEAGGTMPAPGPPAADLATLGLEEGSEVAAIRRGARPAPRDLTDDELALLGSLGPLIRTPREAKRLLNLYRMVRSTRDLSAASDFLGAGGAGEYQAVGLLLGLLTAHPSLLGQLLWAPPVDGVPGGICHRAPEGSWGDVVAGLLPRQDGDRWCNDVCASLSAGEREEWSLLIGRLGSAGAQVTIPGLAAFQKWGPRVARFSFLLSPLARSEVPPPLPPGETARTGGGLA